MIKNLPRFRTVAAAALLALASSVGAPAALAAPVRVDVDIAPPAPRHEVVPAPRRGYVWAPGYWDYRYRRHVWVGGGWVRERRGYVYGPPVWVQRGDRWHFERGGWRR